MNLPEPLQLTGAGWTKEPWPKGLFAKVADATNAPEATPLTPDVAAMFAKAGLAGSFLAWVPGCTRGVDVKRTNDRISFRVLALSSRDDYALAARLAAAAGRITATPVHAEHGPDGDAIEPLAPDAFVATFDDAFFERNAHDMGRTLADDIARGSTWFFQGPHGFVRIGPEDMANADDRITRARAVLRGDRRDEMHDAVLLTAAMMLAAGADGKLDDEEARQIEAHFATVKELRAFDAQALLSGARRHGNAADLAGLSSPALRKKALVLAAEVLASARKGQLVGNSSDPNVRVLMMIAQSVDMVADTTFLQQVVITVAAKYVASGAGDDYARSLAIAMTLACVTEGQLDPRTAAVFASLARTVPELRGRDFQKVLASAHARVAEGLDVALRDLGSLTEFKNKCFAIGAEVAFAVGNTDRINKLRDAIRPSDDYANAAIAALGAKYA